MSPGRNKALMLEYINAHQSPKRFSHLRLELLSNMVHCVAQVCVSVGNYGHMPC